MSLYQDTLPDYQDRTLAYLQLLDARSAKVVAMAERLPMPDALRNELAQTWRITRQKLAYFRRELEKADGEFRRELEVLHNALLPEVINYQVRLGFMMITDTCTDQRFLTEWKNIWQELKA